MSIFIPDPFIAWIILQSKRAIVACIAIGFIAFIASIVFRAIAMMIDSLHGALHSAHVFCMSLNQVYMQSGIVGQFLIGLVSLTCLGWIIYRGGQFLYQSYRGGQL